MPGAVLLFYSFPCLFDNFFCNIIFMQIYQFYFALLTRIMDLGAADLSLEGIPQMFMECSFFAQCFTASVLCYVVDTAPDIVISKERIDQSICGRVIKITSLSKGVYRAISRREAHQSHPYRYAFYFYIHTYFLLPFSILISCASAPSAPLWCSVSSSAL